MTIDRDLIEAVERAVGRSPGSRPRTADDGERWLDCRCPLHDDRHRSASFSLDQGTFYCRVCDPVRSLPLDRVAGALAVRNHSRSPGKDAVPTPTLRHPKIETARWSYDYYWPNGELSHRHWRVEFLDHPKEFFFQTPSGQYRRPDPYWPLYGDLGCVPGSHLILTEGEKATDSINVRQPALDDVPIRALTAGSTQDLVAGGTVQVLLHRLAELTPASVTLWPDADEAGLKAMREVQRLLQEGHQPAALLKPEDYQLSDKQDAADFLARGGDLQLLLQSLRRPRRGPTPRDIAAQLVVLRSGGVLWPGTEAVTRLDQSNCSSLWQKLTGSMPTDRQTKELLNMLRDKVHTEAVADHYRVWADARQTFWRPEAGKDCYRLSAEGIDIVSDTPQGKLLASGPSRRPSAVDVAGEHDSWVRLASLFGLSELERALILAWLVCCLTGRETPILLSRGYGNTGKSTLARAILALVEPTCPEIDAGTRRELDDRQLVRTLQRSPALLLDNVSSLPASVEDILSRLVTEYVTSLRRLYTDDVELVALRRAIIITTTNWDVYKGDLASRIIVCQPRLEGDDRYDPDTLRAEIDALLPQVRGYVFKLVCRFYAESPRHAAQPNPWRVASLGLALSALGYDARDLNQQERAAKAATLNANDAWMEAIVAYWEQENGGREFMCSTVQIVEFMRQYGVPYDLVPAANSGKFPRWVEEKQMLLRDHGFWMERVRTHDSRGYWFRRA